MIGAAFHSAIYLPIYNGLVYFVGLIPNHDIGIAVIVVTIVVRVILFPLSRSAVRAQMAMKQITPEVEELRKKYKGKPQEESKAIFALYRERGIRPFSGILLVLVQLPVLIGLYFVFAHSGFPTVNVEYLYSFIHAPSVVNMEFLGLIDMGGRSIVLALLASLTQFTYTRLSMGPVGEKTATEASFSTDLARSFDVQARYILPIMIGGIAYSVVAAAPLYWVTSNLFMIVQEYAMGRRFNPRKVEGEVTVRL